MFGFLNVNKPTGITSRAVVNAIEKRIPTVKVGHAGTLDPLASGVLILGLGPATRLLEYIQGMKKSYRATFLFGQHSETDDVEGKVEHLENPIIPSLSAIQKGLSEFEGTTLQRPPKYSALKVRGRRAYDLARRGLQVELAPREITIYDLKIMQYDYPRLEMEVVCSRGTYIRALGRDIAHRLNTTAVLASLRRTAVGNFDQAQSADLSALTSDSIPHFILPPQSAVRHIDRLILTRDQAIELSHGRILQLDKSDDSSHQVEEVCGLYEDQLIAILHCKGDNRWAPHKVFFPPNSAVVTGGKV